MNAIDVLKNIGSVEQLKKLADEGLAPAAVPVVNSHIHMPPNFSAFDTVAHAIELAGKEGVKVLGVSNYYDYSVYNDVAEAVQTAGIFPLFGLEIISLERDMLEADIRVNDPGNPGKFYICGKGITKFTEMTPRAAELLGTIRTNDAQRMKEMADKMAAVFASKGVDTGLDDQAIIDRVTARHSCRRETVCLQERHLAQMFQEVFFENVAVEDRVAKLTDILGGTHSDPEDAVKIQGEIRSALMKAGKSCFVDETFVNLAQACELITELGGMVCYPTLADGSSKRCEFETPVEKLVETLKEKNIYLAEMIPGRNSPEVLAEYVKAYRDAGIIVVAGTEHNSLALDPITPSCVKGQDVPADCQAIFWEGACVVAAHEFLTAHGECGYVDAQGQLNSDYADADSRIKAFAQLGAAVIAKYIG